MRFVEPPSESRDQLTGLRNREHLSGVLSHEVARAHRDRLGLALLLLDLNKFKQVNDEVGHAAGDHALRGFAERVRTVARSSDVVCRVGGDEFGVVLPESSFDDATQFSMRLNREISAEPIAELRHVTVSYGIAELLAGEDAETLMRRADEALYRAKGPPDEASGMREPRRPKPSGGSAAVREPL